MKRLSPAGLRAVAVVLIAISGGCAARAASHEAERLPLAVVVERARAAAPRAVFEGPGSVAPAHTYHLAFEVSGRITDVRADVGDRVRPGALLAAIDDRDFRAQVDAANARAAAAAANALRTTSGARPQERAEAADAVGAARAAVSRATAALALAAGNEARVRQLLSSGYVAAQQADTTQAATLDARAQLRSAQALLGAAQQREALVRLGPRDEDRTAATADATAARAGADVMRSSLAKTAIYAPADAFVESRSIELGDMASPGITAFTLTDAGTPDILVAVPEALVGRLRVGMPARVVRDGAGAPGTIVRIEPAADAASRSAQVRVRAPALALQAGGVVDVSLAPAPVRGVEVPAGALVAAGRSSFVARYDAARRSVRLVAVRVIATGDAAAVVSGIAAGDAIVVAGAHDVRSGDAVRVVSR